MQLAEALEPGELSLDFGWRVECGQRREIVREQLPSITSAGRVEQYPELVHQRVGLGAFGFHDVWVTRADSGEPSLVVEGAARELAERAGVSRWHLSITHTESVAIAYVIAIGS